MTVNFANYTHSFLIKSKHVFVPSSIGRRIGEDIKGRIENNYEFDDYFYHLRSGGHVAALHAHRSNSIFCKVDIENFFYSISRNRVVRELQSIGVPRASHYGKWSCVKNPYEGPSYALPYGFVQSPIIASLVLSESEIGRALREMPTEITVAVYVDDISLSSSDPRIISEQYLILERV